MLARLFIAAAMIVAPATAAFAEDLSMKEKMALKEYCKPDIERLCGNVEVGGGRIKACLASKKEQLSVGCAKTLQEIKKEQQQ